MWVKVLEAMAGVCGGELGEDLSLGIDNASRTGACRQSYTGIQGWGCVGSHRAGPVPLTGQMACVMVE